MELACRGYMDEPEAAPTPETWPSPFSPARAEALRTVLEVVLTACLAFARNPVLTPSP
jgi:formiminoglutamase